MKHNLKLHSKLVRLSGQVAAGTDGSRVTSLAEVDTQGYSHAMVVAQLGTVSSGGVFNLWAKLSHTSGSYGAGTVGDVRNANATDWSNKFVVIDEGNLRRRYLRVDYQRTTANVTIDAIWVLLYSAAVSPAADANSSASVGAGTTPSTT